MANTLAANPLESNAVFTCTPNRIPTRPALRRLSHVEYVNAIRQLTSVFEDGAKVFEELNVTISNLVPQDAAPLSTPTLLVGANFRELDQNEGQAHVEGMIAVAEAFAALATNNTNRMRSLVGECSVDADAKNDDSCLAAFVEDFSTRALRRPPTNAELQYFTSVATDEGAQPGLTQQGIHDVIVVLLSSPQFLYQVENNGTVDSDGVVHLTPQEVATRLSFLFWQSPPDAQLMEAARTGEMDTPARVLVQANRLRKDRRFRSVFDSFSEQWLKLDKLPHPEAQVGQKNFDKMRGSFLPTAQLREHVSKEALDFLAFVAEEGGLPAMFGSRQSFVSDADLAELYNVAVWNGTGVAPSLPKERTGLLTRAALVMSGTASTRPIMKGVFIRRSVLCDELDDAPANINRSEVPALKAPYSVRQAVQALTENRIQCSSCHEDINPLGYATENFDALARLRNIEQHISADGTALGELPVNTETIPSITQSDPRTVRDGVQLQELLSQSDKPASCLSRQLVRFALRTFENDNADGCTLEAVRLKLSRGAPLADAWTTYAISPAFRSFRKEP